MVLLPYELLGSSRNAPVPASGAAGRFVVAAMAQLTHVTQGKRFFTL
jgi:hypothetical protein